MTTITTSFDQLVRSANERARATAVRRAQRATFRAAVVLAGRTVGVLLSAYLTVLLSLTGVGFLVGAAFTLGLTIGFAATGVAFLLLAFYAESERRP